MVRARNAIRVISVASMSCLYGKLLARLLAQKLIRIRPRYFHSGYAASALGTM